MISRRRLIGFCVGYTGAVVSGWRTSEDAGKLSDEHSVRLAHSAVGLVWATQPPEHLLDMRPTALAHAAMALEAVGERGAAADALAAGWNIAGKTKIAGVSLSLTMAKLAEAAAYLGDRSLCYHLFRRAFRSTSTGGLSREFFMVARRFARVWNGDFIYRIDTRRALATPPTCLLEFVEERLAAGDLPGAILLAHTISPQWDVLEKAVAQALLARVIARPNELAITS